MTLAESAAIRFARKHTLRHPITEEALDAALIAEELRVIDVPTGLPLEEFRKGKTIGIRADQPASWRLWLKAHALGHYLLHRGDQFNDCDEVRLARQEREADLFAGWLLIGDVWCESVWELAEERGIPVECVQRWLEMARVW